MSTNTNTQRTDSAGAGLSIESISWLSLGETSPGSCGGSSSQVSGPASPGNGVRKYDTFLPRTFKNLRTPKRDRKICLLPVVAVWLAVAPVAYILQRAAAGRVIGQESAGSQEPGAATLTRGSPVSTQHREPRHYHATVSPLTDPHKET